MQLFRSLINTVIFSTIAFAASAQDNTTDQKAREKWLDNNIYSKSDALDFIKLAYTNFTYIIGKHDAETGIYSREVKLKDCTLIIETESRDQESSFKSNRVFNTDVVVIDFDKVILDGNDIKPADTAKKSGVYEGTSVVHSYQIPSYSILTATPNRDDRFVNQHYEEHLQWAFQYLIDECARKSKK